MTPRFTKISGIAFFLLFFGFTGPMLLADEYKDGKKAYELGENDDALRLLVIKLRKDCDHQDAIMLFKTVMPLVITKHQKAAQDYEAQKDWDKAFTEYEAIVHVSEMITSITPMEQIKIDGKKVKKVLEIPTIDVRNQRQIVIDNAAEMHYQKGISFMNTIGSSGRAVGEFDAARKYVLNYKDARELSAEALYRDAGNLLSKNDYKSAVYKFRQAQEYIPGYKDAAIQADKAKQLAMRRIAIMPFTNLSGKTQFGEVGQILADRTISESIQQQPEFLEFVTREYVDQLVQEQALGQSALLNENTAAKVGKLIGIHAFVFGKVLAVTTAFPPETSVNGNCEREKVISFKPYQTTTIRAQYIKHTRQGYVEMSGSYQIVDVEKGTIVKSENITKRKEDRAQWVTYAGDEDALDNEVKKHNTTGDRPLEPPESLANKAVEEISKELAGKITAFFR